MKSLSIVAFALLTSFHQAFAATATDVLSYEIPTNAIKIGPHFTHKGEWMTFVYLSPGAQTETAENKVAVEYLDRQTHMMFKREMWKEGKLFGVQKEWYPNGQIKSESPMRDGVRDGTFRYWDEQDQLVGQYEMTAGAGTVVIYSSQGQMIQHTQYKDNQMAGLDINMGATNYMQWLVRCEKDKPIGVHPTIYGYGFPASIRVYSLQGQAHGPYVRFTDDGHLYMNVRWYVNGNEVSAKEYEAAAAQDPTLPRYFTDATRYKELITPEMWTQFRNFRDQPKVKIPLEFDAQNRPALATP